MPSHPETPSGEDLNQVADYYRQQAQQHAAQGDQASADICYQVADMADNLRHRNDCATPGPAPTGRPVLNAFRQHQGQNPCHATQVPPGRPLPRLRHPRSVHGSRLSHPGIAP